MVISPFTFRCQNDCFYTRLQIMGLDNTQLWHHIYGHFSINGLRTSAHKEMVWELSVPRVSPVICTCCVVGKQHRESIPKKSSWRVSQRLDLVHSDICRPIKQKIRGVSSPFFYNFSRKTRVSLMPEKPIVFDIFKKFKIMVKKSLEIPHAS